MSEYQKQLLSRLRTGYPTWANQLDAADAIEALVAERDALRKALGLAYVGLSAGCAQYAGKTSGNVEVPGDEQYPWVRAMQIGRDAARAALRKTDTLPVGGTTLNAERT